MSLRTEIKDIAERAKAASRILGIASADIKNAALLGMAAALKRKSGEIIKANLKDITSAKKAGLSAALIDRLALDRKRIVGMAQSLQDIAALDDPVGGVIEVRQRPNGLKIEKVRVPIGVVGIIYESRPNVTSDCAGLCLKSGNSVILRGGKEAFNSNTAIYEVLKDGLKKSGLPEDVINIVPSADRAGVGIMLGLKDYIDLIIPRGGEGLINEVVRKSKVPVIKHYKGVCHIYVDEYADLNMAEDILFNAKVQRPGVCNAAETLLVHKDAAVRFLPSAIRRLKIAGVEIRGCSITSSIIKDINKVKTSDWAMEYLDLILAVKVVGSIDQAIVHINSYGSGHSDAIVTDSYDNALNFLKKVDSACVYVNASTRFTDGGEFGMGAEMGISTDKLHARGPMGIKELTTYKYIVFGAGQVRF